MTDRLDATFYRRHPFTADPTDRVDRWCQLPYSGNRASVRVLLDALDLGGPGRILLDPFCGAGSTLLAGAGRGGTVLGCDVEPGACLATALKLSAPALAADLRRTPGAGRPHSPLWNWADAVAALVDGLSPGRRPATIDAVVDDCTDHEFDWQTTAAAVVCSGAAEVTSAPGFAATGRVDVFTSPPHGTGRSAAWSALDPMAPTELLDRSPDIVRRVTGPSHRGRGDGTRGDALADLDALLLDLQARGRLGRVAVEYEVPDTSPDVAGRLAARLSGLGLADARVIPLHVGSPDGLSGVLGGGVVVAGG